LGIAGESSRSFGGKPEKIETAQKRQQRLRKRCSTEAEKSEKTLNNHFASSLVCDRQTMRALITLFSGFGKRERAVWPL